MKIRKSSSVRSSAQKPTSPATVMKDDDATECYFRAQAFHRAAKAAVMALESNRARQDFDVWPVVYLFRQALELHLKGIAAGPSINYLLPRPDPALVCRTLSLRRLEVVVRKILRAVEWSQDERVAIESGVVGLTAIVGWFGGMENHEAFREVSFTGKEIRQITKRLDEVIGFLDATSDALAAMWDTRGESLRLTAGILDR